MSESYNKWVTDRLADLHTSILERHSCGAPVWISVAERLPEPETPVLVACRHNKYAICVGFVEPQSGRLRFAHETAHPPDLDPPTHWQPLPEPPEDKS